MTVTASPRFGLTRWSAGGDPFTRAQMDGDHDELDTLAAGYLEGLASARPAASAAREGFFHYATDTRTLTYCDGVEWVVVGGAQFMYGDGSDGDVTIASGTTTLTRDMFYDDLTVDAGATLDTGGYRIFVRNVLTNNGTIRNNGNHATDAANGAASTAGTGLPGTGLQAASGGGGGAGANINNQVQATAGQNGNSGTTSSIISTSGAGGAGGGGAAGSGVSKTEFGSGVGGAQIWRNPQLYLLSGKFMTTGTSMLYLSAGPGGGGGGAATTTTGTQARGGSGGGGGGLILISAGVIAGTGLISARGGDGGDAYVSVGTESAGGGGGGGGGLVIIGTRSLSAGQTIDTAGGAAGTGAGASGAVGTAGQAGDVFLHLG